jgi:exo-beta-1,3-glucanase (GH17 family)
MMVPTPKHRRVVIVAGLLVLAALLWPRLPLPPPGAALPEAWSLRFPCLSYSPFRTRGLSPAGDGVMIPASVLEHDLRQLASVTNCVRVYGTANGLDQIPAIAGRLGMRVWLGAWIGSDSARNQQEITRALALAHQYQPQVERLIIGSEVLLRGEQSPEALASLLGEALQRSPVPIAYADVWEVWQRHHATLAAHVDEAVVHILPYWEDQPVGIDRALAHVIGTYTLMQTALAPLPVVIGETGWPAAGRMRGPARPGTEEQTLFLRELLQHQQHTALPLNVIEAFDQPWKASLEGTAGSAWGVFTAEGQPRFRASGEAPTALAPAQRGLYGLCALAGALLMLDLVWRGRRSLYAHSSVLAALAGGAALGLLCAMALSELSLLSPFTASWSWRALGVCLSMSWAVVELQWLCAQLAIKSPLHSDRAATASEPTVTVWRVAGMTGVGLYALLLVIDGRYMDLAWPLLAAPIVPRALQRLLPTSPERHVTAMNLGALTLILLAAAVVWREGSANTDALAVAALLLLLALSSVDWQWRGAKRA